MQKEIKSNKLDVLKAKLNFISGYNAHIIKYSLFLISAVYTILLFRSQGATEFSKMLQSVVGAIIELAKYTLPVIGVVGMVVGKQVNWFLRVIALLLAVACFYYSIMATKGFQLIELQQINQDIITNSDDYKRLNKQLQLKEEQLKTAMNNSSKIIDLDKDNKNKNNALVNQLNSDIKSFQKQINSKNSELQTAINKKYYNTQSKIKSEIKQLQKNIDNNYSQLKGLKSDDILQSNDNNIKSLNSEIKELNKQIDQLKNNNKSKSGYDILFSSADEFSNFLNWLAVLIEMIGIYFSIIVGLQNKNKRVRAITTVYYDGDDHQENYSSPTPIQSSNKMPDAVTANYNQYGQSNSSLDVGRHTFREYDPITGSPITEKKIGFDTSISTKPDIPLSPNIVISNDLDNDTIEKYKAYMFNTAYTSNGKLISRGHKHISENINIDAELGRKIKGYLEQIGIVKTVGNRTYIQAHGQAQEI